MTGSRLLFRSGLALGLALLAIGALAIVLLWRARVMQPVSGLVTSTADYHNTWQSTPDACALDPQDGQPPAKTRTIVSFLWYDTTLRDPIAGTHFWPYPDIPLRLDLSHGTDDWRQTTALLTTLKTVDPLPLEGPACRVLKLHTWPEPALVPHSPPALGGTLDLDCTAQGRRITAHLRFDRCGR
jgi:hypothetical protein